MNTLQDYSTEDLEHRYDELRWWGDLVLSTLGMCMITDRYALIRELLFEDNDGPNEEWNNMWAIDEELGRR